MNNDFERDPLTDELRASLAAHAREAPNGDRLAERIIHAADRDLDPARSRSRGWRTWTLPLIAAGAVAGVVAAVVGIENYRPSAEAPPGSQTTPVVQNSTPVGPTHTTSAPTATPTDTSTLHGVKILDLTFVSDNAGFALASANCIGKSGRCTALLRTTDGKTWKSMPGSAFNVAGVTGGCRYRCVSHIRFADKNVGYAFGPHAFLMTTDGGQHWSPQPGGALFVETLDSNVIRVTGSPSGCPGPCNVQVETSAIGSTTWTSAAVGPLSGTGLSFARGGSDAYLLVTRNPAGGASNETSTLYRSANDGRTWTSVGEPCARSGGEVDSRAVAGAPYGRVSVLCTTRFQPSQRSFVTTSTDHGATFTPQPGTVPRATATQLTGDPTTVLVTAGTGLARSTDGGRTWRIVPSVTGDITFVGFESATVGRAVSADGQTIWTTRDAGKAWTPATFG
jgi:photosystem II stability/assembly factor-like uncharacterized protein